MIPVLFLITIIVFVLMHIAGDPVALMLPENATEEDRILLTKALGLDQPLYIQYIRFLGNLLQGDFGESYRYNQPALPIVLERLPASFELALSSIIVATIIAIPLGILSAIKGTPYWMCL